MSVAKLTSKKFHLVPGKLKIGEWFFDVPLSYPSSGTVRLFARSVEKNETPSALEKEPEKKQLPWFLFLQGGPGMACRNPSAYSWIHPVLDKGYKLLFLDQRGTGLSSPITAATLAAKGSAHEQANYLRHFRADSIVEDCEAIRKNLTQDYPDEKKSWSILGQSFGGFCATTYLSTHPEGLKEVFMCGGLPPLVNGPDAVYKATYRKVVSRNNAFYAKYPEDEERILAICEYLTGSKVRLPCGGTLSREKFLQLGIFFGFHGGIDTIHDLVLRTFNDLELFQMITRPTLSNIEEMFPFDNSVIYALLHEPLYCQGTASKWSAERLYSTSVPSDSSRPFFTGEMIYEWMFRDYPELQELKEVADILAEMDDWPAVYDEEQLAKNEVPVYATTYIEDMYVEFDLAQETAAKINNCKQFITNVMYHNALTGKSDDLMKQLFALRDDVID